MSIVTEQHLDLIKKIVMSNSYYQGNEDLLSSFCNDVYSKSYLLFKSVSNYEHLYNYMQKIATNAMISVLKRNNRLKNSSENKYMTTSHDDMPSASSAGQKKTQSVYDIYKINDPFPNDYEFAIDKPEMIKLLQLVQIINSENSDKKYSKIFFARYIYNKSLETIATELKLSENEINQRLLDLADIIRENVNI